jgi:NADH dehydrogenase
VQVGEEKIATRNALWTAGVVASPLANALGVPLVRGKVPVEPELNVPGYEEAYVVGDMAYFLNEAGKPLPA